jgi:hypothetical protein
MYPQFPLTFEQFQVLKAGDRLQRLSDGQVITVYLAEKTIDRVWGLPETSGLSEDATQPVIYGRYHEFRFPDNMG